MPVDLLELPVDLAKVDLWLDDERFFKPHLKKFNEELVRKARETKVHRGQKLRVDTTVIESDIHHPIDAGLLADGVRMITPRG